MARAWPVVVVAIALGGGCEPGFPLPTVQGPATAWSPPRPDPNGPCLQTGHTRRHYWLWKNGVEQTGPYDASVVGATADDPAAHALALRARTLDRVAIASALTGLTLWWSGIVVAVELPRTDDELAVGVTAGALALGGFTATVLLALRSERDKTRAIDVYNANCRR